MNQFKHILLVEDDEAMNFLSVTILEEISMGSLIGVTTDGEMALDYISKKGLPDIIFLDIRMPIMDGFEFLEEFTKRYDTGRIKVVIMTSSTRMADRQRAFEYHCVIDYMEKPLTEKIFTYLSKQANKSSELTK